MPTSNSAIYTGEHMSTAMSLIEAYWQHHSDNDASKLEEYREEFGMCELRSDFIETTSISICSALNKAVKELGDYPCAYDYVLVPCALNESLKHDDMHKGDQELWDKVLRKVVWLQLYWKDHIDQADNKKFIHKELISFNSELDNLYKEFGHMHINKYLKKDL